MVAALNAPSYFEHVEGRTAPVPEVLEWEDPGTITVRIVTLTPERAEEIRRQIEQAAQP